MAVAYAFDRFLKYQEMTEWLQNIASEHPNLVSMSSYGTSHEGRTLWLMTITDSSTGAAEHKPAHWVDANIHAVEVTGGVAALHLIHHLVDGYASGDTDVVEALRTRTFYVAPRVNPDGVEAALGDKPHFVRSSMRPWPWTDGHRWPGLLTYEDIDGDGRVLTMRLRDEHGAWVEHPSDARVMIPVDHADAPRGAQRYRLLSEGSLADYDGFTIPQPRNPRGLDMNRNFPAGWDTSTTGAGDHPLSEPEIDALVRAITVEISGATPVGDAARKKLGKLDGRVALRMNGGAMSDGTGDHALATWTVNATRGTVVEVVAQHLRAGRATASIALS